MKTSKYLSQIFIIFISVMAAFIADDWRDDRQDIEDFKIIMKEIENDIRLDSIEMPSDKAVVKNQIDCIDKLLNNDPLIRIDSRLCLDIIMFVDWPDYVLTGIDQLKNSKIIPIDNNAELMILIYEYYQWIDYHYLQVGPAFTDVHELQKHFINWGFPPVENETITESDVDSFRKLQMDTKFITRLKYLRYNRKEELRIYEMMQEKNKIILDMFRRSKLLK